jgi:hypothetical protein
MSETLFDYQTRLRDEEVLYLLRAIAEKLGVPPFDLAPTSVLPPAPALTVLEEPAPAPTKTRAPRFSWSKADAEVEKLEALRTGWRTRKEAATSPDYRAKCQAEEIKYKNLANCRREAIKRMVARGTAEIVDGVLYDLRRGRHEWDPRFL